ncbi:hypothetical protein [Flavobacterium sp. HSC-61S13]|uniref:hypothetical protein n=1 Tax=Flavobacterium sp. HSC-61S13 TaxID=2910963 RepID=UPI00209D6BA0|nr:hypothetical protein [Flavobacterium sp. HSC-61S13]MCP1997005.1 membrane-associated phospholipid phosphatase [Flavobacterium sp. HSC-61S13]
MKLLKRLLVSFSYFFHPIIIPILAISLYFLLTRNFFSPLEIVITFSQVLIMTFLLPITLYYFLRSMRLVKSSIMLHSPKERLLPIIIYIFLLIVLKDYVLKHNRTYEFNIYVWGSIYTYILLLLSVYAKQKFSVHVAALTGCITFFTLLSIKYYMPNTIVLNILVLVLGVTASSRLYLRAHRSSEIILGFLCGMIPQLIFWQIAFYKM